MNETAKIDRASGTSQSPEPPYSFDSLTARAAAARLGVSERTIRRAIARGELPAVKQGSSFRIAAADLADFASRGRQQHDPPGGGPRVGAPDTSRLVALPVPDRGLPPLPEPLSSFVGRHDDLAAVSALLRDPAVRLLTLTGPGGIGKTRLAIEAATAVRAAFRDGAVFVGLAAVTRPELVTPTIGQVLGLREGPAAELHERLVAFLRAKHLLLVLDNFEQVLAAAPPLASLLAEARELTILVTSRAPCA